MTSVLPISDSNVSNESNTSNESTPPLSGNDKVTSKQPFQYPAEFFQRIPKADLHIHLDGSIRIGTLIDLAKEYDVSLPSYDPDELQSIVFPATYSSLEEYLRGFGYITNVLRTREALERVAYEVATDAYRAGVRYLELRFAPQLHAVPGTFSIRDVLCAVHSGLSRAATDADERDPDSATKGGDAPEHFFGIIACAMRFFLPSFSPYYEAFWEVHKGEDPHRVFGLASVALVTAVEELRKSGSGSFEKCNNTSDTDSSASDTGDTPAAMHPSDYIIPIVAIDVAGAEAGYPASDHAEAFNLAHQSFLHKTVHAGEGYGPESIFSAITDLHAERIGHGLKLFNCEAIQKAGMDKKARQEYVDNLTRYLGTMRICLEVCLTSNLQTMPELDGDIRNHPAKKMIEEGLAVTFCTDNTLVSHTNMVKELTLAAEAFALAPGQLRNIVFNGFKRSFMPMRYRAKRDYNRRVISYYKKIEKEFGYGEFGSDFGEP